jgi:hypothetical protein
METLFAFQPGVGGGASYTAKAAPDYWELIGLSGILEVVLLFAGIILVGGFIFSATTKRRRHRKPAE